MNTLHVLNASGDLTLTWDSSDPASIEKAREEVRLLKSQGYSFFLVDGTPADEIAAGSGSLSCRRVEAEQVVQPSEAAPQSTPQPVRAVATRPLRGG